MASNIHNKEHGSRLEANGILNQNIPWVPEDPDDVLFLSSKQYNKRTM